MGHTVFEKKNVVFLNSIEIIGSLFDDCVLQSGLNFANLTLKCQVGEKCNMRHILLISTPICSKSNLKNCGLMNNDSTVS
jgi:hypothetical protein